MTDAISFTAYMCIAKNNKGYCSVFANAHPYQPGLYCATVLYFNNQPTEISPFLQYFTSTTSIADTIEKAELWIKENLFSDYDRVGRLHDI